MLYFILKSGKNNLNDKFKIVKNGRFFVEKRMKNLIYKPKK